MTDPTRDTHSAYGPKPPPDRDPVLELESVRRGGYTGPTLPSPLRPAEPAPLLPRRIRALWPKVRRALIIAAVLALLWWGVSSCAAWLVEDQARIDREAEVWKRDPANPVNACIAKGGVPITEWGQLERCDFPGAVR